MNEGSRDFVTKIVARFYLNMMEPKCGFNHMRGRFRRRRALVRQARLGSSDFVTGGWLVIPLTSI
jgi:hypothetical protein